MDPTSLLELTELVVLRSFDYIGKVFSHSILTTVPFSLRVFHRIIPKSPLSLLNDFSMSIGGLPLIQLRRFREAR
jgi:hypothetical protein